MQFVPVRAWREIEAARKREKEGNVRKVEENKEK